jgi:uncharacterized protein YuzE
MIIDTENGITYDPDIDAFYIYFDKSKQNKKNVVAKTIDMGDYRYLDVDKDGKVIGLEILFLGHPDK